jgi:hypothetical protein
LLGFTPTGASKYFLIPRVPFPGPMPKQTLMSCFYLRIVQKLEGKAKLMAILSKSSSHSHAVVRTRILKSFEFKRKAIFLVLFRRQSKRCWRSKSSWYDAFTLPLDIYAFTYGCSTSTR